MKLNVLVIGSGAREHAMTCKIGSERSLVANVLCLPGNFGMAKSGYQVIPGDPSDHDFVLHVIRQHQIDLTIIGPEAPLFDGLADTLRAKEELVFGPGRDGAWLEGSKVSSQNFSFQNGIPAAQGVTCESIDDAIRVINSTNPPYVLKVDGSAAGKGVAICHTKEEAIAGAKIAMVNKFFGNAGARIVIQEFLEGPEVSLITLVNTKLGTVVPLIPVCDYKRVGNGNTGENTGGMGSYARPRQFNNEWLNNTMEMIVRPTVDALTREGIDYRGALYFGLIETKDGTRVLEYNCRFGDPETQVLMLMLRSSLAKLALLTARGELSSSTELRWRPGAAVAVTLASEGYPGTPQTGRVVHGLNTFRDGWEVFHAGTTGGENNDVLTSGGRVLTVAAFAGNIASARGAAYRGVSSIRFEGMHYRGDIALDQIAY